MIANLSHKRLLNYSAFFVLGFLSLSLIGGIVYVAIQDRNMQNKMYPNTFIDDINVGELTKEEVKEILTKKHKKIGNVSLEVLYKKDPIATFSAEKLKLQHNIREIIDHTYLIGRTTHTPSKLLQKFTTILHLKRYTFHTHIIYDENVINDFVTNSEYRFNKQPKNALFTFQDGRVTAFKPDEKGLAINSFQFKTDLTRKVNQLNDKLENKKITLTDKIIDPEITLAEANNQGIEELIGEGKSDYTHSIPSRVHNLILATSKFNGIIIPKGADFSFNQYIGDISASTGYQPAYVISNGRTVLGDGGGVCQVSTTIFRAALNTGLPITERNAHAYRVSYYENDSKPGLDATIYTPTVDFKFKNDTNAAILVQTEIDKENNILVFKLYGKKDNRKVELSPVTVWDVVPAPAPVFQDDPTLPRGQRKQVDFATGGAKAKFSYKVFKNNALTMEKEFTSVYRPWAAVFLVGTAD